MKKQLLLSYTLTLIFSQSLIEGNPQEKNAAFTYYRENLKSVGGWLAKGFLDIIVELDRHQKNNNVRGNMAEIGVYHGKSFIPLYLLANNDEFVLAVDTFEEHQPEYGSGMIGVYQKFISNLERFTPDRTKYREIKGDSSKKIAQDYINACNGEKFRMFSVDGCHRAKETEIDLKNAFESLVPGGIIIVDDYFNYWWPEVSEGVSQFLLKHKDAKPFFIGFNKLLITQTEYAPEYLEVLKRLPSSIKKKESPFYNSQVIIYEAIYAE